MKTQTIKNIAKKFFLGSILTSVIFLSAQSKTFAANNFGDSTIKENLVGNVSVKYIGNSEDGLFFNVKYNNEKGKYFDVVVKDESGDILYEGSFNDKYFDKKFLLPKDHDVASLSIAVIAGKNDFVQNYNVTVKSNSYTDVVVSKD